MQAGDLGSVRVLAGWLLILSFVFFLPAGMLYAGRAMWNWKIVRAPVFLYWERGLVMAPVVIVVLGWTLLEKLLEAAGDFLLPPLALTSLLLGAAIVLVAETYNLSKREWLQAPIVAHVILAFIAQALFGVGLLRTGLLPGWVGWAAVLWSVGCPVYLFIFHRRDIYYPWVFYVIPLIAGIALLAVG